MHKVFNFLTVLLVFSFISIKLNASGIMTTVAGDLMPENENVATATLITPKGIAVDNQGNIYIVDNYTEKVKKLEPNGNLTDLGIPNLSQPYGVVADASGNIYISDTGHGLIKRRNSLGEIISIAGDGVTANNKYLGPTAAAGVSLINPFGLALDQSGNLYIADKSNSAIRKLQLGSNLISTLAGRAGTMVGRSTLFSGDGGQATNADLQYAFGVAVDSVRNVIYIADTYNHRIRKVDSLGVITTVAGSISGYGAEPVNDPLGDTRPQGYRGDGGPATSAMLDTPTGLAVDSTGNLYIADTGNCIIRKVDTNGIITTVAGTIPLLNGTNPIKTFAKTDTVAMEVRPPSQN
jgi:sugar lactone lactonase YvrE